MMQQVFNMIMSMFLARFMLNDVPHMLNDLVVEHGKVHQYADIIYETAKRELRSTDEDTVAAAALLHNTLHGRDTDIILVLRDSDILAFLTYRMEDRTLVVERTGQFDAEAYRTVIYELRQLAWRTGVKAVRGMRIRGEVMYPRFHELSGPTEEG